MNHNIFSPNGGINRLHYFIYFCLFVIVLNITPLSDNLLYLLAEIGLMLLVYVLLLFNVKKRVYDIMCSNLWAWIFAVLFCFLMFFAHSKYIAAIIFIVNIFLVITKGKSDKTISM